MKKLSLFIVAMLLTWGGLVQAQSSKSQIKTLLEDFCQSYYNESFGDKQYIEGTLTVSTVEIDESKNVIKVRGKHSYRGQYIPLFGRSTHSNVDFKAEITESRIGMKIKFWKWSEPDITDFEGHWEGPVEKTIIP